MYAAVVCAAIVMAAAFVVHILRRDDDRLVKGLNEYVKTGAIPRKVEDYWRPAFRTSVGSVARILWDEYLDVAANVTLPKYLNDSSYEIAINEVYGESCASCIYIYFLRSSDKYGLLRSYGINSAMSFPKKKLILVNMDFLDSIVRLKYRISKNEVDITVAKDGHFVPGPHSDETIKRARKDADINLIVLHREIPDGDNAKPLSDDEYADKLTGSLPPYIFIHELGHVVYAEKAKHGSAKPISRIQEEEYADNFYVDTSIDVSRFLSKELEKTDVNASYRDDLEGVSVAAWGYI